MAYVPVPKDLTHVRQKVLFNLTRRQLVCFLGGALVGAPLFYLLKPHVSSSVASLIMVLVMMPFILLGVYEKNGEPLEAVLRHIIESRYLRPRHRIYQTQNIYALLEKQAQLENEVKAIAQGNKQKARNALPTYADNACCYIYSYRAQCNRQCTEVPGWNSNIPCRGTSAYSSSIPYRAWYHRGHHMYQEARSYEEGEC